MIINDVPTYRIDHMPYGGVKASGLGREGLKYTIEDMTEPRLMVINRLESEAVIARRGLTTGLPRSTAVTRTSSSAAAHRGTFLREDGWTARSSPTSSSPVSARDYPSWDLR